MGEMLKRNPLLAALAVAAVILAGVVVLEFVLVHPGPGSTTGRRGAAADAKLLPALDAMAPEQAYPETSARPLFTPTRRLAPEPATAAAQPTFQPGQFVLLGVTVAGDTRIAMLREKSTGRLYRIGRGGEVNGIKVAVIEPESVTLAMGAQQESLPLTVQRPGAPGTPGTPGAPGGSSQPAAPTVMLGPFGPGGGTPVPAGAAPPNTPPPPGFQVPGVQQAAPVPGQFVGQPPAAPGAVPGAAPAAPPPPTANTVMTPEEILAARRARRAQQTQ